MPLLSVIVRCSNEKRAGTLREALVSVLSIKLDEFECIVVCDGLNDRLRLVAEGMNDDRFVFISSGRRIGRAAACNLGIQRSSGYYLSYLDDDDLYTEDGIKYLINYCLWTGSRFVYGESGEPGIRRASEGLLGGNFIHNCEVVHERSLFSDVGMFDTALWVMEDWDMWLRFEGVSPPVYVPKFVSTVRYDMATRRGELHQGPRWDRAKKRIMGKWKHE